MQEPLVAAPAETSSSSSSSFSSATPPLKLCDGATSRKLEVAVGSKRKRLSLSSLCNKRRAIGGATPQAARRPVCAEEAAVAAAGVSLAALSSGPYFVIASWLDSKDLCRVDTACKLLLSLNSLSVGPWRAVGDQLFFGTELDIGGALVPFDQDPTLGGPLGFGKSWKARYEHFYRETPMFGPPFGGSEISVVYEPDEVAYCRCRLRTDLLASRPGRGVYVEVEVKANADNLSLAVVDFEGGGRSSLTFSPETGAVLRERKVREAPRAIEGTYIHLLPAAAPGRKFQGAMGLYLLDGHLAFFRRWALDENEDGAGNQAAPNWETTGFCTNLSWAEGPRLSMCLAFRDNGAYRVKISRVTSIPPLMPTKSAEAYQEKQWSLLYGDDNHPLAI